jgi:hypothetical protein
MSIKYELHGSKPCSIMAAWWRIHASLLDLNEYDRLFNAIQSTFQASEIRLHISFMTVPNN